MNTKRMICTDSMGDVRRITAADGVIESLIEGGATEAEAWDSVRRGHKKFDGFANFVVVEAADLPYSGRIGRFAWKQNGATAPVFDMARGGSVKTDQIRVERDRRLTDTDVEILMLDGAPASGALKAKRQVLRDIPATIQPDLDAITTPEALDAWEPTWPE